MWTFIIIFFSFFIFIQCNHYIFCAAINYTIDNLFPFVRSAHLNCPTAIIWMAVDKNHFEQLKSLQIDYNVKLIPIHDESNSLSPHLIRYKEFFYWSHFLHENDIILTAGMNVFNEILINHQFNSKINRFT